MKSLYESIIQSRFGDHKIEESILDTDVLDKADKGAQRLLTVLKTASMLVDELDIVQAKPDDDPNKSTFMAPVYFQFNPKHSMPSDVFKTVRERLNQFEKRVKDELNLNMSINTTRKRTAMVSPATVREYGLKQSYDNTCQYDIKFFDKDRLLLGAVLIKIHQYDVSKDIHDAGIYVDMRNGISSREWYKALFNQMGKNK